MNAKFPGKCKCGCRFNKGASVVWKRGLGVVKCPECKLSIIHREIEGRYFVRLIGRGIDVTGARVECCTAELVGCGFLHFNTLEDDGRYSVHGTSPTVNFDLDWERGSMLRAARSVAIRFAS